MVDNNANNNEQGGVFTVLTQYLKDFSFESPNAPNSLRPREKAPEIEVGINVNTNALGDDNYDVILTVNARAGQGKDILFNVELVYGGVFRLQNIPQEHIAPLLFVECPRLLFPFARQILADATRNGGFPPLLIDPVDFAGLFQKRLSEEQEKGQARPN